ncbi:MAG: TlpA family protein disulfide reductase [Thaumarchaeota archaeon]|nr:TlpA family protein disulfide reductase [Nitrososphaerota archaeon]
MSTNDAARTWKSPSNIRLIALGLILATSFAAISIYSPNGYSTPINPPPPNQKFDDWRSIPLLDVNGNQYFLKDYQGKVVVLEFMASWCLTCAQQEQVFKNDFYPKYKDNKNVVLLSVTVDPTYDTPDVLKNHIEKKGIPWTMLRDTTLALTDYFKVKELSTTMIISPNGEVKNTFLGLTQLDKLSGAVDPLLP